MTSTADRQARSRKARAEAGGKQISVMLTPAAAETLARLIAAHYADSATVAICRALRDAAVARGIEPR